MVAGTPVTASVSDRRVVHFRRGRSRQFSGVATAAGNRRNERFGLRQIDTASKQPRANKNRRQAPILTVPVLHGASAPRR